jgi:hypothetical protein
VTYGTAEHIRDNLNTVWEEVPRDLEATVIGTLLSDDGLVFILYPDHRYAVVPSIRGDL